MAMCLVHTLRLLVVVTIIPHNVPVSCFPGTTEVDALKQFSKMFASIPSASSTKSALPMEMLAAARMSSPGSQMAVSSVMDVVFQAVKAIQAVARQVEDMRAVMVEMGKAITTAVAAIRKVSLLLGSNIGDEIGQILMDVVTQQITDQGPPPVQQASQALQQISSKLDPKSIMNLGELMAQVKGASPLSSPSSPKKASTSTKQKTSGSKDDEDEIIATLAKMLVDAESGDWHGNTKP